MTDEEMRQMAESMPDSLVVAMWRASEALRALVWGLAWAWIELLRLDKLLGRERPQDDQDQ